MHPVKFLSRSWFAFFVLYLAFQPSAFGKEKTVPQDSIPKVIDWTNMVDPASGLPARTTWTDPKNATLYLTHAADLLGKTIGTCRGYGPKNNGVVPNDIHICGKLYGSNGELVKPPKDEVPNFPGRNEYVVIHLVAWKSPAAGATTQDVDKQNWYVFTGDPSWDDSDFGTNNRIFGKKVVYLFYLYFNHATSVHYNVRYEMKEDSKLPVFLDHLIQLGQIWGFGTSGGARAPTDPNDVWGIVNFKVDYVPSDLTMTPKILPTDGGTTTTLTAQKFDNEGKYHTDFSVPIALTSISDISYVSSSNTLVPAKVDKQRLMAAFDYHPWAFDAKGSGLSKYPYLLAGVGMGSKPLQRSLFAVGYGSVYANFYAGLLLNTQSLPANGQCNQTPTQVTGTLSNRTCKQFSFGLNVGVGSILNALKNNNSGTAKSGQATNSKQP